MTIKPITPDNLQAVLALSVAPDQMRHIETTQECLDEAAQDARWRPIALVEDENIVGFAMYGSFPAWIGHSGDQQVWLDRLLIDARFQGRGLGEGALRMLLARLAEEYDTNVIYLSVYGDNAKAIALYEKYGFVFTGELDTKGEKVMRRTLTRKSVRAVLQIDGKFVLIHRIRMRDGQKIEYYVLPGGGIEESETAEEAIVREIREEIGIDAVPSNRLYVLEGQNESTLIFFCRYISGTVGTGSGPEFTSPAYADRGQYVIQTVDPFQIKHLPLDNHIKQALISDIERHAEWEKVEIRAI